MIDNNQYVQHNGVCHIKNWAPRHIQCYKLKRYKGLDPYTIVFTHANKWAGALYIGQVYYVSAGAGVWQHGEVERGKQGNFGSRVRFYDLPKTIQRAIIEEYEEIWHISMTVTDASLPSIDGEKPYLCIDWKATPKS